jgi:hypothetical protein
VRQKEAQEASSSVDLAPPLIKPKCHLPAYDLCSKTFLVSSMKMCFLKMKTKKKKEGRKEGKQLHSSNQIV